MDENLLLLAHDFSVGKKEQVKGKINKVDKENRVLSPPNKEDKEAKDKLLLRKTVKKQRKDVVQVKEEKNIFVDIPEEF